MKVSDALAGAASETSTLLRVKRREKKLRAIARTPRRNIPLPVTALMAPRRPDFSRMISRSPMRRMAPAVRTSPAMAVAATVMMVAQVSMGLALLIRCYRGCQPRVAVVR